MGLSLGGFLNGLKDTTGLVKNIPVLGGILGKGIDTVTSPFSQAAGSVDNFGNSVAGTRQGQAPAVEGTQTASQPAGTVSQASQDNTQQMGNFLANNPIAQNKIAENLKGTTPSETAAAAPATAAESSGNVMGAVGGSDAAGQIMQLVAKNPALLRLAALEKNYSLFQAFASSK